jgi:hypothetical protein
VLTRNLGSQGFPGWISGLCHVRSSCARLNDFAVLPGSVLEADEFVKLTDDFDSSKVVLWLRKRTPRNLRRMPSSET